MHLLMVSPEMIVPGKALPTLGALEHPLSQVKHLVSFEALRAAEALAAFGAPVRPHARVLPLVSLQVSRLSEALPTVRAEVGLLPGVSPKVHVQLADVREALAAVLAAVRLLTCVNALMLLQTVVVGEAFSTVGAQVQNLHLPEARVRLQRFFVLALFSTRLTYVLPVFLLWLIHEAFLIAMGQELHRVVPLDVFDEVALHGEGELTEGAWEMLRGAVMLHAGVAFLVLFKFARCGEVFTTAATSGRVGLRMCCLLVSFQKTRLVKCRTTLSTFELFQRTFVCSQIIWVFIRLFAPIAAKPFVLCQHCFSDRRRLGLRGVAVSLGRGGCFAFRCYELGYGRNVRSCFGTTGPVRRLSLD